MPECVHADRKADWRALMGQIGRAVCIIFDQLYVVDMKHPKQSVALRFSVLSLYIWMAPRFQALC